MEKYISILKEFDIFENLNQTQLALICSICEFGTYGKQEVIFEENSTGSELFLIIQGQIDIVLNPNLVAKPENPNTEPQSVTTFRRGQSFGEIALLDKGLRSASAISTKKNTKLIRISKDRLILLCDHYPELGYRIMHNIAIDLAQKLRNTDLVLREKLLNEKL